MADPGLAARVADFLYLEAELLDARRFRDWLALYDEDAVFWVPTYTMQGAPVEDPTLSVNLIYIESRAGLEDRIFRIETGESAASSPLPNVCHVVANVRAAETGNGLIAATAAFQVASWSHARGPQTRAGRYDYRLRRDGTNFRIARKKVLLVEEVIDGWFDVVTI